MSEKEKYSDFRVQVPSKSSSEFTVGGNYNMNALGCPKPENIDDLAEDELREGLSFNENSTSFSDNEVGDVNQDEDEGGGGRNGRPGMGDVMNLNQENDNNNYNGIPNENDENDDPNDNNNTYEDNQNFDDFGLQVVVNGNETNFFV